MPWRAPFQLSDRTMNLPRHLPLPLLIALLALSGCQTTVEAPAAEPVIAAPTSSGDLALAEGLRLYEDGDYDQAEQRFLAPAIWHSEPRVQLTALKYLAFTYCVSERPIQCRFAFERALQIDPTFHLTTAESTHPMWGPAFVQAARR